MAPRSERRVGDENDAAAVPVEGADATIVASADAIETGGAKLIRTRHNDEFIVDGETRVDGAWQQFAATKAKAVIEAAERNGVKLAVADVEKKG